MSSYLKVTDPERIPVPGNKIIEEYIGRINTDSADYSVAHMIAPPGWSEPSQQPDFDEFTIMIRGRMHMIIDEDEVILKQGEVILIKKGSRVQYSNPFKEENEYWAVCVPAFSPESANRDH
ncbi:cupin domain-containing protein [Balneola sp. MJW-20]|uniref:cupin domain-containing protein n=1 Tax=Gracilimonas aurantiaca TaxID=3234185 RepID=UPI00346539F1